VRSQVRGSQFENAVRGEIEQAKGSVHLKMLWFVTNRAFRISLAGSLGSAASTEIWVVRPWQFSKIVDSGEVKGKKRIQKPFDHVANRRKILFKILDPILVHKQDVLKVRVSELKPTDFFFFGFLFWV
jgi:hypothetical protein